MGRLTISRLLQNGGTAEAQAKRTRFLAAVLGALLLIALAWVAWAMWPESLPPPNGDPIILAKFAATPTFARLPREKQDPYIDHMMANVPTLLEAYRSGQITPTEGRKAFDNAFGSRATRHVEEYFTLKTPQARLEYIDNLIAQQERQRLLWSVVRTAGGGGGDRWLDTGRIKERIETMPPAMRTQFAEFVGEMRRRREQKGITDGTPPR